MSKAQTLPKLARSKRISKRDQKVKTEQRSQARKDRNSGARDVRAQSEVCHVEDDARGGITKA